MDEKETVNNEVVQEQVEEVVTPVEQLDDVEFEKEQEEKKKKNSKVKKILLIILAIVLVAGIGLAIFFIVKMGSPEKTVEDFVGYFNAGEFENVLETMDLKGFYALSILGLENSDGTPDYTKFESEYEKSKDTEECKDFIDTVSKIDVNGIKEYFKGITLNITAMKEPVKIQNTKGVYKISTNIDLLTPDGQTSSDEVVFYVAKIDGKYKIINGELPASIIYAMILLEAQNIQ